MESKSSQPPPKKKLKRGTDNMRDSTEDVDKDNANANVQPKTIDFDAVDGATVNIRIHRLLRGPLPSTGTDVDSDADPGNDEDAGNGREILKNIDASDCTRLIAAAGGSVYSSSLQDELRNVLKKKTTDLLRVVSGVQLESTVVTSRDVLNAMACQTASNFNATMKTYGLNESQASLLSCCDQWCDDQAQVPQHLCSYADRFRDVLPSVFVRALLRAKNQATAMENVEAICTQARSVLALPRPSTRGLIELVMFQCQPEVFFVLTMLFGGSETVVELVKPHLRLVDIETCVVAMCGDEQTLSSMISRSNTNTHRCWFSEMMQSSVWAKEEHVQKEDNDKNPEFICDGFKHPGSEVLVLQQMHFHCSMTEHTAAILVEMGLYAVKRVLTTALRLHAQHVINDKGKDKDTSNKSMSTLRLAAATRISIPGQIGKYAATAGTEAVDRFKKLSTQQAPKLEPGATTITIECWEGRSHPDHSFKLKVNLTDTVSILKLRIKKLVLENGLMEFHGGFDLTFDFCSLSYGTLSSSRMVEGSVIQVTIPVFRSPDSVDVNVVQTRRFVESVTKEIGITDTVTTLCDDETFHFLCGVRKYILAEVLEVAGSAARDNGSVHITPRHLSLEIDYIEDLRALFRDVNFVQRGVIPYVHPTLSANRVDVHLATTLYPFDDINQMEVPLASVGVFLVRDNGIAEIFHDVRAAVVCASVEGMRTVSLSKDKNEAIALLERDCEEDFDDYFLGDWSNDTLKNIVEADDADDVSLTTINNTVRPLSEARNALLFETPATCVFPTSLSVPQLIMSTPSSSVDGDFTYDKIDVPLDMPEGYNPRLDCSLNPLPRSSELFWNPSVDENVKTQSLRKAFPDFDLMQGASRDTKEKQYLTKTEFDKSASRPLEIPMGSLWAIARKAGVLALDEDSTSAAVHVAFNTWLEHNLQRAFANKAQDEGSKQSDSSLSTCNVMESLSVATIGLRAGNSDEYIDAVGYVDLEHWGEDPLPAPMSTAQDDWRRLALANYMLDKESGWDVNKVKEVIDAVNATIPLGPTDIQNHSKTNHVAVANQRAHAEIKVSQTFAVGFAIPKQQFQKLVIAMATKLGGADAWVSRIATAALQIQAETFLVELFQKTLHHAINHGRRLIFGSDVVAVTNIVTPTRVPYARNTMALVSNEAFVSTYSGEMLAQTDPTQVMWKAVNKNTPLLELWGCSRYASNRDNATDFVLVAPTLAHANENFTTHRQQLVQSRMKKLETVLVEESDAMLAHQLLRAMSNFFSLGDKLALCVEPSSFAMLVREMMKEFVTDVKFSTEAFTMIQLIVEASVIRLLQCAVLASVDVSVAVLRMPPHTPHAEELLTTVDTNSIGSTLRAVGEQDENPLPLVGHSLALLQQKDFHFAQKLIGQ